MKTKKPLLAAMEHSFLWLDQIAALPRVDDLVFVLETVASGIRLRLLLLIVANDELRVSDLSSITGVTPMEIARHLARLVRANLVLRGIPDDESIYRPGEHPFVHWLRNQFEDELELLRP